MRSLQIPKRLKDRATLSSKHYFYSSRATFQGCKRDLGVRDRDETETETFPHFAETEMRPRPRR